MIYPSRIEAVRAAKAEYGRAALSDVHFTVVGDDQAGYQFRPLDPKTGLEPEKPVRQVVAVLKAKKPKAPKKDVPEREISAPEPSPEPETLPNGKTSAERHAWLEKAVEWVRPKFEAVGSPIPKNVRVSIGFTGSRMGQKAIGACWYPEAVSDGHAEIFIGPHTKGGPSEIVGVIIHELVHAAVGKEAGHKGPFK